MRQPVFFVGIFITVSILTGLACWWSLHHHFVLRLPSGFYPEIVHLEKEDSVTFINLTQDLISPASGPHPTHTSYPSFDAKEGIKPGHFWTFTFIEDGAYTFHDHFAPEVAGIVVSGSYDISLITDQRVCEAMTDEQEQQSCIEIYFKNITKQEAYPQVRAVYEDLAVRYPKSCHNFAHDLGKNAYTAYLQNTLGEIGQEASSCAYGFWHGFTTAMQTDLGFAASKDFCASFNGATKELRVVNRMNCYHGIGIGLIPDPPPPVLWGDLRSVTEPALDFCDAIQGDPLYKERCLTGIFHAMADYMVNGLYGFKLDQDTLAYCKVQKQDHQYACFITLVTMIPILTNYDLPQTLTIIQKHSPSQELFFEMFMNAAIMLVDIEWNEEELGDFVQSCDATNKDLRQICIKAVINKLYTDGNPGFEYKKAFEFCRGTWVENTEQRECLTHTINFAKSAYAPEKFAEVCGLLTEEYRSSISDCSA
jgi:hypothetical protein